MSDDGDEKKEPRRAGNIGFGRPPVEHQFKPGQSGNPKGRPAKPKDNDLLDRSALAAVVRKEAGQRLTVREGDKKKRMTSIEAVVRKVKVQALSGDHRAQAAFIKMVQLAEAASANKGRALHEVLQIFAIPDNGRDDPEATSEGDTVDAADHPADDTDR